MYLKNLTLKGFKSFAEATTIGLERGVTVVVGPNGTGKSNVVDAIAWVLGAQSPSAVRSQKMDDVIFAGTSEKPALGRAAVSVTIDNSTGRLPVEFSEVRISRTLFRSGESSYALNGVPCRLLDIAELLSDGGMGRHQHVIVSQGQIEAVLDARPTDRRVMIEEASGVLKFRKRRERAERRLAATEGELVRVGDLMRELRRMLRPLEKQAAAARRHCDLVAELEDLRVYLLGLDIVELRGELRELGAQAQTRAARTASIRTRFDEHSAAVASAEQKLSGYGGDDLGELLGAVESRRERARGLTAVVAERQRGIERERANLIGRDLVAGLEAEAARCQAALSEVEAAGVESAVEQERLAVVEAELSAKRTRLQLGASLGAMTAGGGAAELRGELGAVLGTLERAGRERQRLSQRIQALGDRADLAEFRVTGQNHDLERLLAEEEALNSELALAEAAREDARSTLRSAGEAHGQISTEQQRFKARQEALRLALDDSGSAASSGDLVAGDGTVGLLADLVEVDESARAAFRAAVGEVTRTVVVADSEAARRTLEELAGNGFGMSVLKLCYRADVENLPPGLETMRSKVRAGDPRVESLLDAVLASIVYVDDDWRGAVDVAVAHPDLVVVSRAGDRLSPRGWQLASSAGGMAAALDEANEQLEVTALAHSAAVDCLAVAEAELATTEARVAETSQRLDSVDTRVAVAAAEVRRSQAELRDITTRSAALVERLDEIDQRLQRDRERSKELEQQLPELTAAEAKCELESAAVSDRRTELTRRCAAVEERRRLLSDRKRELDARLAAASRDQDRAGDRYQALDRRSAVLARLDRLLAIRLKGLEDELDQVRTRRRRQSEQVREVACRLDDLRTERDSLEQDLEALRRAGVLGDVRSAELRTKLQTTVERLGSDHGLEPDAAATARRPRLDESVTPAQRVTQIESELEIMGPVNPLALEEYEALAERQEFLQGQLDDIRGTRRDLGRVIRSIDEEIKSVLAAAFVDVAANFEVLFGTLFPGGEGRMTLSDPDDLLNTGIEITAKPSGKKVKHLTLLSGGERTLTALGFLFAIFRSRPSPFYVLDEVEAALDDVNLHRFLALIDEFRTDAQLVIVTHQKRTMEAADFLYGVSMKPGGTSRVVVEKAATPV